MFSPNMWPRDPFYPLKDTHSPPRFHKYSYPKHESYRDAPALRRGHRNTHEHQRSPLIPEGPDFSDTEYESTSDNTFGHFQRNPYRSDYEADIEPASQFKRVQIRVPKRAMQELRGDEILILSSPLTHVKIFLSTPHFADELRAAVAGDMRLRDLVKQLLPQNEVHEARTLVKTGGGWIEPMSSTKISEVMLNERREVEVRIVVGGGGRRRSMKERYEAEARVQRGPKQVEKREVRPERHVMDGRWKWEYKWTG
ncbi:hypothetical protein GQ44DRAFT_772286 [Phaeosphaeriaceae sp. PMI808]|nr:hypothetical protein GQ44DRAFT_772286 [Phaeosphaeriaceae sp. PMI808]